MDLTVKVANPVGNLSMKTDGCVMFYTSKDCKVDTNAHGLVVPAGDYADLTSLAFDNGLARFQSYDSSVSDDVCSKVGQEFNAKFFDVKYADQMGKGEFVSFLG